MKANELMIGDWVQNPLGWKARVQSIKYVNTIKDEWEWLVKIGINNETFQDHLFLTEIEPIPLTAEILEKNGFARDEIAGWRLRQYKDGMGLICEIYWNNKGDYLEIISNLVNIGSFDKKGIHFIHELQHALRLCGIEKEIEL